MDIVVLGVQAIFDLIREFDNKADNEYSYRITKNVFRRLGKVAMSHTLQVFEVMNKKPTYFNINFKFISGP